MSRKHIILPYGKGRLEFLVPDSALVLEHDEPHSTLSKASFFQSFTTLLARIEVTSPIAIVVADKTRRCDYPRVLPWIIEVLQQQKACQASEITFYIAYGTHAKQSDTESVDAYGHIYRDYPFIHHDSTQTDLFAELGTTSRGTPVRVRRDLLAAGTVITVGALSHHYFAGFGGGRKLLFPGLGERQAIACNHRLFLDENRRTLAPECQPGQLTGNPLADDLAEINAMLPPHLAIHGLLNSQGQVMDFRFGRSYAEFVQSCREHDRFFRAKETRQFDLVIASAGGYPKDINFIQTHKAIHNAASFVADGKTLIMLAECADGIGSETFLPYFAMGGADAAFDHLVHTYSGNGGTALALMEKSRRISIYLLSALAPELCTRIGITPIQTEEIVQLLVRSPGEGLAVIRNGSMLIHPQRGQGHSLGDIPCIAGC